MLTTIVAGVDGGPGGRDALTLAGLLGRPAGARVVALRACRLELALCEPEAAALVAADACRSLHAEVVAAAVEAEEVVVDEASPARALHRCAERERAGLVVVGSDRHGTAGRVLLGDVTAATLRGAPCAVAVAPRDLDATARPLRAIGVGLDGRPESRVALAYAQRLAEVHDARLELLRAVPPPVPYGAWSVAVIDVATREEAAARAATDALQAVARGIGDRATVRALQGSAASALCAASRGLDLLVVGSRGRGPLRRLVLGSTTARLLRHAACPVLVVPRGAPAPGGRDALAGAPAVAP